MNEPTVIKGLRRLTHVERTEELREALRSPYYLWWQYLRLSKDYWWVCQQNGQTLDPKLHEVWQDFGDVYETDFVNWWSQRGRKVFAEVVRLPHVRLIDPNKDRLHADETKYLVVEIPLNVTERTISRQLMAILRKHPNRQINPVSSAKRQLAKWRGIRIPVLDDARTIWQVHHVIERAKLGDPNVPSEFRKLSSYHIGLRLRLVDKCMPEPTDSEDKARRKRNGMKVAVTRMLNRARALIANAEIGVFPSFEKVEQLERWTTEQSEQLDAAIAAGRWTMPDVSIEEVRRYLKFTDPLQVALGERTRKLMQQSQQRRLQTTN